MESKKIIYNDKVVRQFLAASVVFGIVGMLVGVIIALQMAMWQANLAPYLTFGRLRPLHTNAAIFAFVGNMLFAGVYHSMQRLLKTRLASDGLSAFHFWAWQAIIVAAAITLPLGLTQGKEYAELIPTIVLGAHQRSNSAMQPYTALELHGRDVYIQEGCYTCHSQMIRPFTWENARYPGGVSTAEDSVWDHPFQWGSKRTGPDLARESAMNRGPVWHYNHMLDPRSTSDGSIMPNYPHLRSSEVDFDTTQSKLGVMQMLGVPYDNAAVLGEDDAHAQARSIAESLASDVELGGRPEGVVIALEDSQLVALIAYLERLGRNESAWRTREATAMATNTDGHANGGSNDE